MKVRSFCKLLVLLVLAVFAFSPVLADGNFSMNVTFLPNGFSNLSSITNELSATDLWPEIRIVARYKNVTDDKFYGTYLKYGYSIDLSLPTDLSVPFHVFNNSDYSPYDCSGMGFDYCVEPDSFRGLNFSASDDLWVALVPNLYFTGADFDAYDYSNYWSAPIDFTYDINVTVSLPVFKHLKMYRNNGKIAVVVKHLSSTPSLWADAGLTDKFVGFSYSNNDTVIACYGEDSSNTGGFCGTAVTGSVKVVTIGADKYSYFVGDDFTDSSTLFRHVVIYASLGGDEQAYWDGDGTSATLNYGMFYNENFYQSDINSTSCNLDESMPLLNGGCYMFSPSMPTSNFIGFDQAFISGIAGLAMILVAFAAMSDFITGGKVTKSIDKHFSNIGKQIK